jgi:undecaprenyl-diphosphatase
MDLWQSMVLGVIQGLTEFLPVSSSGHLVLVEHLLGVDPPGVTFEVILHLGTLLAVTFYFRRRLFDILRDLVRGREAPPAESGRRYVLALVLATIPAALIGVLFKDHIEAAFSSPKAAAGFLIFTGLFLICTLLMRDKGRLLTPWRAVVVGMAQAAALLPGVSRSGSTISAAILLGIAPAKAAEFSFILSIPAVAGAAMLSLSEAALNGLSAATLGMYAVGGLVALVVGYASLSFLFGMIRKGRFWWFGAYCVCIGVAWLIFLP